MAIQSVGLSTLRWNNLVRLAGVNAVAILVEVLIWVFYGFLFFCIVYLLSFDIDTGRVLVPLVTALVILRATIRTPVTRLFSVCPDETLLYLGAEEKNIKGSMAEKILEELSIQMGVRSPVIYEIPFLNKQITIASLKLRGKRQYALLLSAASLALPEKALRCLFAYEFVRIKTKNSDLQREILATSHSCERFRTLLHDIRDKIPLYLYPIYLLLLVPAYLLEIGGQLTKRGYKYSTGLEQDIAAVCITKDRKSMSLLYRKISKNRPFSERSCAVLLDLYPLFFGLFLAEYAEEAGHDLQKRVECINAYGVSDI